MISRDIIKKTDEGLEMSIKKDLKEIRKILLDEVKLLRKGKVTNQRAREVSRMCNGATNTIRLTTEVKQCNSEK